MIVNLHIDDVIKNQFIYQGPYILLERNRQYEICVRHVHIELKTPQITKDKELWCLSSTLVDRSPTNQNQSISYFTLEKGKLCQEYTPASFVFYPLETHQLENPQFVIRNINKEKEISIAKAFIQLEIRKCLALASV